MTPLDVPHSLPCSPQSLQSAVFNFQSLLTVLLLLICVCTYLRSYAPSWLDSHKTGSVTRRSRLSPAPRRTLCPNFLYLSYIVLPVSSLPAPSRRTRGTFYKLARIGERVSWAVSLGLIAMAARILWFS